MTQNVGTWYRIQPPIARGKIFLFYFLNLVCYEHQAFPIAISLAIANSKGTKGGK